MQDLKSDERWYVLALSQCPEIGPKRFTQIQDTCLEQGITIKDFWSLSESSYQELEIAPSIISQLCTHRERFDFEKIKNELSTYNTSFLTITDEQYPRLLRETADAPPVLFYQGDISKIQRKPIAIVGTRNVTSYGRMVTESLTRALVEHGFSIISGFMYGVDSVAHTTAMANNGYTVGVLGFGFAHMYPAQHRKLAKQMIEQGNALLTEYLPHVTPIIANFPMRNRIVAGLSLGVVVTEAASKSGSKITAQYAGEYGREVFSVPGAITSKYSQGTKDLINTGAKLVTGVEDILAEFGYSEDASSATKAQHMVEQCQSDAERSIIEILLNGEVETDELAKLLHMDITSLYTHLSMMELRNLIVQSSGKWSIHG